MISQSGPSRPAILSHISMHHIEESKEANEGGPHHDESKLPPRNKAGQISRRR
jgi:hypothetical protein